METNTKLLDQLRAAVTSSLARFPEVRSVAVTIDYYDLNDQPGVPTAAVFDQAGDLQSTDLDALRGVLAQTLKLQEHLQSLLTRALLDLSREAVDVERQLKLLRKRIHVQATLGATTDEVHQEQAQAQAPATTVAAGGARNDPPA